jgi:hypothetical protein
MCRSAILYSINHFILCQPFHIVPAILYCVSHFHVVSATSCFVSHFHVVSVIILFCQIFYIYCQSFFGDIFLLYVLQVYHLDNLLSNVPVPAGIPRC